MFKLQGSLGTKDVMPSIPPLIRFSISGSSVRIFLAPVARFHDSATGDFTLRVGGALMSANFRPPSIILRGLLDESRSGDQHRSHPTAHHQLEWRPSECPVAILEPMLTYQPTPPDYSSVLLRLARQFCRAHLHIGNVPATRSRAIANKGALLRRRHDPRLAQQL